MFVFGYQELSIKATEGIHNSSIITSCVKNCQVLINDDSLTCDGLALTSSHQAHQRRRSHITLEYKRSAYNLQTKPPKPQSIAITTILFPASDSQHDETKTVDAVAAHRSSCAAANDRLAYLAQSCGQATRKPVRLPGYRVVQG